METSVSFQRGVVHLMLLLIPGAISMQVSTINIGSDGSIEQLSLENLELQLAPASGPEIKSVNIEFGGSEHGERGKIGHKSGYLVRPEAIKSKACTANGCEDCSDPAECFHGVDEGGWGYIVLDIQAGSKFTHYVAEVWARCPFQSAGTQWWLETVKVTNGDLKLYAGNTEVAATGTWTQLPITGDDKSRVRALFYPTNTASKSYAKLWLEAYRADPKVDSCMAVKDCLDLLGDGSAAAFELRNGNALQVKCLSGEMSGMSDDAQATCTKWDACVTTSGKKPTLLALLKAATQPDESLLQGVSFDNETRFAVDASTCVEPSVDDAESLDCECAEEMIATCSGGAYEEQELESCMQTLMCGNSNVCCSWKREHCPSPTCTGALMTERGQASTKLATSDKLHNGLDGAMQGKCSQ